MDTTLGNKFKKIRKDRGMTQIELAKKAKVNRSTIARFESGNMGIKVGTLLRMLHEVGARLIIIDE